jgi:hypothetical protein
MVFALAHLHYFIFLQLKSVIDKMYLQKNKQVQPTARSKKQCHKKSGVSYLNIMWPYRFASHFLPGSCKHAE